MKQATHSTTAPPLRLELLDPLVIEILRRKTPDERLQIGFGLNRQVRDRLTAHFRHRHPDWSEDQVHDAVAQRLLHGSG